jgi:hypothetical protein
MVVEELLTLPPWIYFEGITFEFQLFNNGGNEIRFCYNITSVDDDSPHKAQYDTDGTWYNKFCNLAPQSWLYLQEGIETDVDLLWSLRQCWHKLWAWGLMSSNETTKL